MEKASDSGKIVVERLFFYGIHMHRTWISVGDGKKLTVIYPAVVAIA